MNKLLYIFTLVCATVACSKSEQLVVGGYPADGVVRIVPTVAAPLTRAEEGTEFKGSRLSLGLFYGLDDKYSKTALWKKDADGNWNSSSQLLWKNKEDKVVVYAYVPDAAGPGYSNAYIAPSEGIPSDQSAGLERADWLWYSEEVKPGDVLDKNGKLNVRLNHALLKLTVNLSFGDEFGDTAPEIKEVWLNGTTQKVTVWYDYDSRGQITATTQSPMDIKMHKASDNCYEAIFYPSVGQKKGGKMLTVVLADGQDFCLTLAEDLKFEKSSDGKYYLGGCAYSMNVKVGKDKLQMGTITVTPWDNKDNLGQKKHYTDATEYSEWGGPADIATEYAGGTGTSGDPYLIATASQLAFLAQETNKGAYKGKLPYFKLTGNIDLMGHEWTPIGIGPDDNNKFEGIFDGGNHTILNLKVSNAQYAGLFGYIQPWGVQDEVMVKDLRLREAVIVSKSSGNSTVCAGIMAGYCRFRSNIQNCYVEGSVTGDCYAGGIVGSLEGKISGCTAVVRCATEDNDAWCGGIAGESRGTIDNCTVRGEVKGSETAGGAVGILRGSGELNLCYSFADVSLDKVFSPLSKVRCNVGGLVGESEEGLSSEIKKIKASLARGKVSVASGLDIRDGEINVGGFIGRAIYLEISGSKFNGIIEAGKPASGTLNAGGFIGYLDAKVTATYCLYDKDGIGGLPIVGAKASGADDSGLEIIEDQY